MSAAALDTLGIMASTADGPWEDQVRSVVEQYTRDMTAIHSTRMLSETEKQAVSADSQACSQVEVVLVESLAVVAEYVAAVAQAHLV